MLIDVAATISAGAGIAGLLLALRWLLGGRLPKWVLPAGIGAGMLTFSVWNEYGWFGRVVGALPEEVVVVSAPADRVAYRPWTYLFPVSSRFVALDRTRMMTSAENPAFRRADAMVVQRWQPVVRVPMAFDCAEGRSAVLVDGADMAADGVLSGATWSTPETGDPLQQAACGKG